LVNNCLADIPLGKFALYANERPLEKSWDGKRQTQSSGRAVVTRFGINNARVIADEFPGLLFMAVARGIGPAETL
jgi:hypothetical protein